MQLEGDGRGRGGSFASEQNEETKPALSPELAAARAADAPDTNTFFVPSMRSPPVPPTPSAFSTRRTSFTNQIKAGIANVGKKRSDSTSAPSGISQSSLPLDGIPSVRVDDGAPSEALGVDGGPMTRSRTRSGLSSRGAPRARVVAAPEPGAPPSRDSRASVDVSRPTNLARLISQERRRGSAPDVHESGPSSLGQLPSARASRLSFLTPSPGPADATRSSFDLSAARRRSSGDSSVSNDRDGSGKSGIRKLAEAKQFLRRKLNRSTASIHREEQQQPEQQDEPRRSEQRDELAESGHELGVGGLPPSSEVPPYSLHPVEVVPSQGGSRERRTLEMFAFPGAFPSDVSQGQGERLAWAEEFTLGTGNATSPSDRASSDLSAATGHTSLQVAPVVETGSISPHACAANVPEPLADGAEAAPRQAASVLEETEAAEARRLVGPESGDSSTDPAAGSAEAIRLAHRPSLGIDQEQDAADTRAATAEASLRSSAAAVPPSAHTGSIADAAPERVVHSTRTNASESHTRSRLSQMPRLDSMRAVPSVTSERSQNSAPPPRRSGVPAAEAPEGESSSGDEAPRRGRAEDESDVEGETGTGSDTDTGDSEADDDDGQDEQTSNGAESRAAPPGHLQLPPAPFFGPLSNDASGTEATDAFVGRETWMRFNTIFTPTPSETPRTLSTDPSARTPMAGPAVNLRPLSINQTERRTPHEGSYFALRRAPSRATPGITPSAEAPPPSPSVITRSRAPSTASLHTMRSGLSGHIVTPSANRDVPTLPPVAPLNVRAGRSNSSLVAPRNLSPAVRQAVSPVATPGSVVARGASPVPSAPGRAGSGSSARRMARPTTSAETALPSHSRLSLLAPSTPRGELVQTDATGDQAVSATTTPRGRSDRPRLYQHKSRSLIDLAAIARREVDLPKPADVDAHTLKREPLTGKDEPVSGAGAKADVGKTAGESPLSLASPPAAALKRRRSMFEVGAAPPPYSIIHRRPEGPQIIYPREEEGREKLPAYNCHVHIEGYLPRKMEFSAPGTQAKDRSWRRLYFVLHGTSLRVYKHDLSALNLPKRGTWGEMDGPHTHLEPMNEDGGTPAGNGSSYTPGHYGVSGINQAREVIINTNLPFGHHGSLHGRGGSEPDLSPSLVRHYTLQGAESGLAADYLKRRHVVRVRAEGEQFLLQTRNDRHVVDWIEALQAATNVALDLEQRPMPKFITLPRRRRRRRAPGAQTAGTSAHSSQGGPTAREAEGPATDASHRSNPPAPLGLPGEEAVDPSAAFERMLREEQEDVIRHSANETGMA